MILWKILERPLLYRPVLIEGLPGIGNVGKVTVEYMIHKLKAKKFAELYSSYFPHHVFVNEKGIVELPKNEFYYAKLKHMDLVLLTGDYQSLTPEGHYELTKEILEFSKKLGVRRVITVGGYGVEGIPEKPKVIAAATNEDLLKEIEQYGVEIDRGNKVGMIVGAAGLLLGLGALVDLEGLCLLGETFARPMFTDARAATAVLEVLREYLNMDIDLKDIEEKAKELEAAIAKARELEEQIIERLKSMGSGGEELRYIG